MYPYRENDSLVSIIIPIFNAEDSLHRCVRSAIRQTHPNLEIILVDDGSTDASPAICDYYKTQDPRVIVIHRPNGGLSAARNTGISYAAGSFLFFLDADDSITPDSIESLLESAKTHNADIAIGGLNIIESEHCEVVTHHDSSYDELRFWENAMDRAAEPDCILFVIACGKLYRKALFDNNLFDNGKIHEDEFIAHRIIMRCTCISFLNRPLYNYYTNPQSITHSRNVRSYLDASDAFFGRALYFEHRGWHNLTRWSFQCSISCLEKTSSFELTPEQHAMYKKQLRSLRGFYAKLPISIFGNFFENVYISSILISPRLFNQVRKRFKRKSAGGSL